MNRIKCFLIQKTEFTQYVPYKNNDKPCSCGDPECNRNGYRESVWIRPDTGETFPENEIPAGALWWAPWYADFYVGFDGRCLVCQTPAGSWIVDSQAGNCTRKGDKTHRCWLRTGEPPDVDVGKSGGQTCSAGAGSIMIETSGKKYHGFLRNGYLEEC